MLTLSAVKLVLPHLVLLPWLKTTVVGTANSDVIEAHATAWNLTLLSNHVARAIQ